MDSPSRARQDRGIQSGIFKLSDDVLSSIFILSDLPLLASHICNHWRAVALGYPALWNTLVLNHQTYPLSSSIERITTLLARSRASPLTIDLKFGKDPDQVQAFLKILGLVLPHAGRWRHLYVSTDDDYSVAHLYHQIQHLSVPILEHFSVNADLTTGVLTNDLPRIGVSPLEGGIFTGGAPMLAAFRAFGTVSDYFQPDLSNITSLYIRGQKIFATSPEYFCNILSLPHLECLSLSGGQESEDSFLAAATSRRSQPIVMSRLKHLHFDIYRPLALSNLFTMAVTPNLQSLLLVDYEIPRTVDFSAISFANVIQLRFMGCYGGGATASNDIPFLALFPNVRHIILSAGSFPSRVCPHLLRDAATGSKLLPNLLTFSCVRGSPWDLRNVQQNIGKWRDGLLVNPTAEEIAQLEVTRNLPEIGWDHGWKFPSDPIFFDERLCTRGDEFISRDI
ncbi:hypothetical protein BDN72DRAFT_848720 [Pluteus cervinus]|uniref:Uncharacterized protein n=1 Tax=Pluteus cervinus TaxID=181527 RepID=A0ACD3A9L9_9AGAR|nr:hypothetical protein BDN72DRAFT_848720 [Pluteus cervinus]